MHVDFLIMRTSMSGHKDWRLKSMGPVFWAHRQYSINIQQINKNLKVENYGAQKHPLK